jgi:hypothetical protein
MRVTIECTPEEQIVFKRTLKSLDEKMLITYRIPDDKSKDMTCGEYICSMIKWEVTDE